MFVKNQSVTHKKWLLPLIIASAIVLLSVCTVITIDLLATGAENMHGQQYHTYTKLRKQAQDAAFTLTEGGEVVGVYTLEQLGILNDTLYAIDDRFDSYSRMDPKEFSDVSLREQLTYRFADRTAVTQIPVVTKNLDLTAVMQQLTSAPRETPKDAYVDYRDGSFRIVQEIAGTTLLEDNVRAVLTDSINTLSIDADKAASLNLELTEYDCYLQPKTTMENHSFDFSEELRNELQDVTVSMDFHGSLETLTSEQLTELLQTDDQGKVTVAEDALSELLTQWHEKYRTDNVPYLFEAQVGGIKPIDFLLVDYEINQEETAAILSDALLSLKSAQLEADWYCWRDEEAFAIEGEYVEVDIPNQVMTYVKDGEVLVSTDVVTGASWGYPTPPGLYKVENKDTNCWLSGEDYNVHVDYWIGFVGYMIGIHDADWRTKFGGTNYVKNGSHGCVNTPKEATALIFENIEVGVPVLVYGK